MTINRMLADQLKPCPNDRAGLMPDVAVIDGIRIWSRRPTRPVLQK